MFSKKRESGKFKMCNFYISVFYVSISTEFEFIRINEKNQDPARENNVKII